MEYFVFGSNLAGRHGAGAARFAAQWHGAIYGVGRGITGRSYALPTKDEYINSRTLAEIDAEIKLFLDWAKAHRADRFNLTPVGCGLAGFERSTIWKILKKHGVPKNVFLTSTWITE